MCCFVWRFKLRTDLHTPTGRVFERIETQGPAPVQAPAAGGMLVVISICRDIWKVIVSV
jgi:hypothetical protein